MLHKNWMENFTCMRVFRTYLQDLDDAPVKLKSKVLGTYLGRGKRSYKFRQMWASIWIFNFLFMHNKWVEEDKRGEIRRNIHYYDESIVLALFVKHETSLSASLTSSSIALPSGSLLAWSSSLHTTFIPSTDCKKKNSLKLRHYFSFNFCKL